MGRDSASRFATVSKDENLAVNEAAAPPLFWSPPLREIVVYYINVPLEIVNNNNNNKNNNNNNNTDNINYEKILLTTMLTIKILFTINSLEKKKNYSFKTLFTIPVDLKST